MVEGDRGVASILGTVNTCWSTRQPENKCLRNSTTNLATVCQASSVSVQLVCVSACRLLHSIHVDFISLNLLRPATMIVLGAPVALTGAGCACEDFTKSLVIKSEASTLAQHSKFTQAR
jgi:hypothetical protein